MVGDLASSPNFGDRRGKAVTALILHYTGMPTGAAALAWLRDPASDVSCHYLVWEDGRIQQLAAERDRAWNARTSFWDGENEMHAVSIGVEIVNAGHDGGLPPYPAAQIQAVAALCRDIVARHAIAPQRVLAHSDVAPNRKADPGERLRWKHLAEQGVGLWVDAPPPDADVVGPDELRAVQDRLRSLGYGCPGTGTLDRGTRDALVAFQRHYRPARVDGRPDSSTVKALTILWDIIPRSCASS